MRVSIFLVFFAWAMCASPSQADWAKLKSGEIASIVKRTPDNVTVLLADGSERVVLPRDIVGTMTDRQARDRVDVLIRKTRDGEEMDKLPERIKQLGAAAVPRLVHHLENQDDFVRAAALSCLQFAWDKRAETAVRKRLDDKDEQVKEFARKVLKLHLRGKEREAFLAELAEAGGGDAAVAGETLGKSQGDALAETLLSKPNAAQLIDRSGDPALWPSLAPLVARYRGKGMETLALKMIREGSPEVQAQALVALTMMISDSPETRNTVAKKLSDPDPGVREAAAAYLERWGRTEDKALLEKSLEAEKDPWARATIASALSLIQKRAQAYPQKGGNPPVFAPPSETDHLQLLSEAILFLEKHPTMEGRQAVLSFLSNWSGVLPTARATGEGSNPEEEGFLPDDQDWPFLVRMLMEGPAKEAPKDPGDPPAAKSVLAPVRDYFDPARKSYGRYIEAGSGNPFEGNVHVGDDVAWGRQHASVVSVADGVVKTAEIESGTWGGVVAIEHRKEDGSSFCSLYGHLGSVLPVAVGDTVKMGDKIASLGLEWSRENGGCHAHLHFGIFLGSFELETINGYLDRPDFADKTKNHWTDPQAFLTEAAE